MNAHLRVNRELIDSLEWVFLHVLEALTNRDVGSEVNDADVGAHAGQGHGILQRTE